MSAPVPDRSCRLRPAAPYDLLGTTRWLRTGHRDPSFRRLDDGFQRAMTTVDGVATVQVRTADDEVQVDAWGEGAEAAVARVPALIGLHEAPWPLPTVHPRLTAVARRFAGLRLTDTGDVFEALLVTIPQQLVTWQEAAATWRRLVQRAGAPAPLGLVAPPTARQVRRLSLPDVVGCGLARRRAETLLRVARVAGRLQAAHERPTPAAMQLLQRVRGVGPWTAASALGMRLGRADVVIEGDVHLPHTVAHGLVGQARSDDAEMRELLAPYDGHAMRVVLWLMAAGVRAPRRGPKQAPRWRDR